MTTVFTGVSGVSVGAEGMATERLEAEICALSGHMTAALCRWLLLVAEFDKRQAWIAHGIVSCAHWLSWRCGLSLGTARDQVRVARRLETLPLITASFAAGELSYAKVRALVRVATPDTQDRLLELARQFTASQLERTIAKYRSTDDDTDLEGETDERVWLRHRYDDDGYMIITARVPATAGAAILDALEVAARYNTTGDTPAEPGTPEPGAGVSAETPGEADTVIRHRWAGPQGLAFALLTLARAGAAGLGAPAEDDIEAEHAHLVIHVHPDDPDEQGHPRAHVEGGPPVAWKRLCRLACGAKITRMFQDRAGNPLHLDRTTRDVPPRLRRALWFRDQGCRFPGCTHRRFLHAHHIQWWSQSGPTCITNLVLLCTKHHHLVHEGGFSVTVAGNQLTFTRPDGTIIDHVGRPVPLDPTRDIVTANQQLGLTITPETPGSLANGERLDLTAAVDALWMILQPEHMLN